jgi:hypothetical protein
METFVPPIYFFWVWHSIMYFCDVCDCQSSSTTCHRFLEKIGSLGGVGRDEVRMRQQLVCASAAPFPSSRRKLCLQLDLLHDCLIDTAPANLIKVKLRKVCDAGNTCGPNRSYGSLIFWRFVLYNFIPSCLPPKNTVECFGRTRRQALGCI